MKEKTVNRDPIIHYQNCPVCNSKRVQTWKEIKDFSISRESFGLWNCRDCGFVFTQDTPILEKIGRYYDSNIYISHSDTDKGIINNIYHRIRKLMLSRKQKLVEKQYPSGNLLDYGTGTGYFAQQMSKSGWNVTALEISPAAREKAYELFKIKAGPPDKIKSYHQHFQVITLWHVLEHVHDLLELKADLINALAPEGILVVAVPNRKSFDARYYGKYWAAFDVPRHLWHFSQTDIENLFLPEFKLEKIHRMPFDAYYVSILSEKYRDSGILGMIRALIIASLSNLNSIFASSKSSSIIYILKKR